MHEVLRRRLVPILIWKWNHVNGGKFRGDRNITGKLDWSNGYGSSMIRIRVALRIMLIQPKKFCGATLFCDFQ